MGLRQKLESLVVLLSSSSSRCVWWSHDITSLSCAPLVVQASQRAKPTHGSLLMMLLSSWGFPGSFLTYSLPPAPP